MFKGSIVALVTPFSTDGALDEAALAALIDWQIAEGTNGLVPVGTTGESPTLTHAEHRRVVDLAVRRAAGRVPVIAGAGSNSTREALDLARHARESGADAVLVVTPYYNKPTQEGLYRHYMTIADAVEIPLVIYNIPARSVIDMSVETMARLSRHPNIVGVKDATANLSRPLQIRRTCGAGFNQLSGEDGTTVAFLATGGEGCISVTANVAPGLCARIHRAWQEGAVHEAMELQQRLSVLHDALFVESNPVPAKYALSLIGRATETVRLPLVPLTEASRARVREALDEVGLTGRTAVPEIALPG